MTVSIASQFAQVLELHGGASSPLVFESFDLPSSNQRLLGAPHSQGTVTPLALRPSTDDNTAPDLDAAISSIKSLQAHDSLLSKKLSTHGTLLFRGLPINSADDFSKFAHAFGYSPHEVIGIIIDRPLLAPNVAPANEAPKEVLIYNHNESFMVPHAPEYIFLHCRRAPKEGGETPISSSLELFQRAKDEIPEFIDELAEKGMLSKVTYKVDIQFAGGSTLKQAFGKEIEEEDDEATKRAKIEKQIKRYGRGEHTTWEWTDDGQTLVLAHRIPVIRTQPGTGLPTLFTALAAHYKTNQRLAALDPPQKIGTLQLFGDGTPIPEHYCKKLAEITDEIRVLHKWQQGDVLVYDNIIAQHGRQPWKGKQEDREVMVSTWDGIVPGKFEQSKGDWAQVVQASEG
ncbi:Clavaminate synthase-like protein [Cucurbitaria berberidis CBS 394.84]|uniref:Clavaminate synthase-like protein n=1 Tax=Cucurbitaria berberidis CBS 394.84 TaxID=1168544 RepID=A0A9P4L643_9PLEO|nr:Clavaminate synthase-like protein [Cucurbitaria berberidis CBS 394.84]KAF1843576.1 Clavaminate synthase-like protein [Cucurbitaria berberidis CBS 394.84]